MGDRGQVLIKDEGIYLYTHWGATELTETVRRAMAKRRRWDDPEYLARIIFDEMIGKEQGQETGFGISKNKHGDVWKLITVDCKPQKVTVEEHGKTKFKGTFEEFIT
jgi:hypothetical protein